MRETTPLIVVCGPTASGKTGFAVALAKQIGGEVVSADSMQVYRGLDIGSAKPAPDETAGVRHHMIDVLDLREAFSVVRYVEMARAAIEDVAARGKRAVLAGGTGLYIDSLTRGTQFPDIQGDPGLRESLAALARSEGREAVWRLLRDCDPLLSKKLHPNNLGRVIRAVEVFRATGVPMSEWQRRSRLLEPPYRLCMLGLLWPRQTLYERINLRVDQMMERGLLAEARALYEMGDLPTASQAIGYKELFAYFRGEFTLEQAVEEIKRESRRYAKRQTTWLRRDERLHWIEMEQGPEAALEEALARIDAADFGAGGIS